MSALVRQAWDTGDLQSLTKTKAAKSTGAHISIVGHITKDELRRELSETATANGFANRFLWVCVRRSKVLPEGGAFHTADTATFVRSLRQVNDFARNTTELCRDEQAREAWRKVYAKLSEGKPGLVGAVTSRAEAQTMRLACLYALLDCSPVIRVDHLLAGLAV